MSQRNPPPTAAPASRASASDNPYLGPTGTGADVLSVHGSWIVARMGSAFPATMRCVALAVPDDETREDAMFAVTSNNAFLLYERGFHRTADVFFAVLDLGAATMVPIDQGIAMFGPGDDFAAIAALADPSTRHFGVQVRQYGSEDTLLFANGGFREAYAELGRVCGFDTRPILDF